MPTTLTRRAALLGAAVSAGAVAAAAVPALARSGDACTMPVDEAAMLAGLVENYRRAYQAFEAVFDAQDRGEADDQQIEDALTPIDDALVALCAATCPTRMFDAPGANSSFGCEGLMQAVYDAFLA